jgi:hypothetical protein
MDVSDDDVVMTSATPAASAVKARENLRIAVGFGAHHQKAKELCRLQRFHLDGLA